MTYLTWDRMVEFFPILSKLDSCKQDKIWHGEGSVGVHTRQVLDLLEDTSQTLRMAACFHDIGKLKTSRTNEDGRIIAPSHARIGARMTQKLLYHDYPNSLEALSILDLIEILKLVEYHGIPVWAWGNTDEIVKSTTYLSGNILAMLARADIRGRESNNTAELIEAVGMYELACRENGCWDTPYLFPNDNSRYFYLQNPAGRFPSYDFYDGSIGEIVVMSGLPGSGKDTWIEENLNLPMVSLDEIRKRMRQSSTKKQGKIISEGLAEARNYLRRGTEFVWNSTNLTKATRAYIIRLINRYNFRARIVYLHAPWEKILSRNDYGSRIPISVLEHMAEILEIPTYKEAHSIEYIGQ